MAFYWNPRNLQHLSEMWSKGLTAREIAAAIGCPSRNAVIAQARRRGLAGRPSPIKTGGEPKPRKPRVGSNNPNGRTPTVDRAEVSRLLAERMRGDEIAAKVGCSASYVSRIKNNHYPTLKQGAHRKALAGTAQRQARDRSKIPVVSAEPFLQFYTPEPADNANRETVPPVPALTVVSEPSGANVTLLDLKQSQCAWIVGNEGQGANTLCCGDKISHGSGRPFCLEHRIRARGKIAQPPGNLGAIEDVRRRA